MMRRRFDDEDDDGPYDKRYPGRKVVADGGRVRVPVMLTDAMPPEYRAAISRDRACYEVRQYYPPRTYVGDSASLRDAERKAVEARDAWIRGLQDAWKQPPSGQMQQPPDSGNGDDDDNDDDPRADYINRISNAWRTPVGNPYGSSEADAIQRAFNARISPGGGARPGAEAEAIEAARRSRGSASPRGVRFGPGSTTSDAAINDRDAAYNEYLHRLQNGWRT